jgi:Cdc6-like AAA superfamily ATPase
MTQAIESASLSQRVVLLGIVELSEQGETPAHSGEVKRTCAGRLREIEGDVVGGISESEVIRALNDLAAEGILSQDEVEDRSPVGKGRPAYSLSVDPAEALDTLREDERLGALVDEIRADAQ